MRRPHIIYADDDADSLSLLLRLRAPSLFIGLCLGVVLSFATSRFEEVLQQQIAVAFFLPFIVYVADAVGSQTEAIYTRDLKTGEAHFHRYLWRELCIGTVFGILFGLVSAFIAYVWIGDMRLAWAVGLSMAISTIAAPIVALCTARGLQLLSFDPAAGAGPLATVIQDMICVLIYGAVCTWLLL